MIDYKKPSILKDVQTTTSDSAVLKEDELMKPEKQKLKCEKCGNTTNIHTRYDKSDYDCTWSCRAKEKKEHLHYYCRNCFYDWIGPVKKEWKK